MKSFDTDIKKYAEKTRLKAAERHELRERVLAYMEYHPLPKQPAQNVVEQIESQQFVQVSFNTIYTRVAASVFAVLLMVVIPVAAERAVPGDVLYPFKTNINEGVRLGFANSPYEKVALETTLLERRIAEARLLESEGKLTEEIEASISETVRGHADAAQQGIEELRGDSEEEAAIAKIAFSSALEVQSAVLDTSDSIGTSSRVAVIAGVVKEAQADVAAGDNAATPSFSALMARVELETTRAHELFESVNERVLEEGRADTERRLEDIARKITSAQKLDAEGSEKAAPELVEALALTQKLIAFMTDIEVSENVALETLVPIEFTDAERIAVVDADLKESSRLVSVVYARIDLIESTDLLEKVRVGLQQAEQLIASSSEALEVGDITVAENTASEAYAFAGDLDQLTIDIKPEEEQEVVDEEVVSESEVDEGVVEEDVDLETAGPAEEESEVTE